MRLPSLVPHSKNVYLTLNEPFTGQRKWFFSRLLCQHSKTSQHTLIDHRPGPGWMSDAHEIHVCVSCGKITQSRKVY